MPKTILSVVEDGDRYKVFWNGYEYALATYPRIDSSYDYSGFYMGQRMRHSISFDCMELPPPPPKPEPRKWSRAMGLRKPKERTD